MARRRMNGLPRRAGACSRHHVADSKIASVVAEVARETGVSVREIKGHSRVRYIKEARWEAWRRLCGPTKSIASVARQWPCDHSSIIHALNRLEEREAAASQAQTREAA